MIHLLQWLPGRVRSCWDRRSCVTEGSPTQICSWLCAWERKGERQVCVCVCVDQSCKQTSKQNYIQEGIFFLAEAPLPSVLRGSFLDCTVLGVWQLLLTTTHSGTSVLWACVFQSFLCFPVSYSYHQGLGLKKCMQVSACFWVFQVLLNLSNKV